MSPSPTNALLSRSTGILVCGLALAPLAGITFFGMLLLKFY